MPYYAGDYYTGDYYGSYAAGGLGGWLKKTVGKALGVAGSVIPGPVGAVAKAAGKVIGGPGGAKTSMAMTIVPPSAPIMVPAGTPGAQPTPGLKGIGQRLVPGGASGFQGGPAVGGAPGGWHWNKSFSYSKGLPAGSFLVRNRSLNPANPRALRRSVRRQQQFVALARRVLRGTGMTIKRSGTGARAKRKR